MEEIYYKGRMVTVWDGAPICEERINGESWLSMRNRTEPERKAKKKEDFAIREEVRHILKLKDKQ